MDKEIIKEDWETAKKQMEAMMVNATINIEFYKRNIAFCEEKIKEFPDDPMPEEVKEIVKEVKTDG